MHKILFLNIIFIFFLKINIFPQSLKGKLDRLVLPLKKDYSASIYFFDINSKKTIYKNNEKLKLIPASILKLFTTAVCFYKLKPNFRFETPIFYTGKIKKKKLIGDLIISGSGDPMIVSEILWQTVIDIKHMGIEKIEGNIFIDQNLFKNNRHLLANRIKKISNHSYDSNIAPFSVNFNNISLNISRSYDNKVIASVFPYNMNDVNVRNYAKYNLKGTKLDLIRFSNKNNIFLSVKGNLKSNQKKVYVSAKNPYRLSANYINSFFQNNGITISGIVDTYKKKGFKNFKKLYTLKGYFLKKILFGLNTYSNNFMADMLINFLGVKFSKNKYNSTMLNGIDFMSEFIRSEITGNMPVLYDGSGLNTKNRLSSQDIIKLLTFMNDQIHLFPDFLTSLPAAGWHGYLKNRFKNFKNMHGYIRAKTGTLSNPKLVSSISGYILLKNNYIAFSIIINSLKDNFGNLYKLRNIQDKLINTVFRSYNVETKF